MEVELQRVAGSGFVCEFRTGEHGAGSSRQPQQISPTNPAAPSGATASNQPISTLNRSRSIPFHAPGNALLKADLVLRLRRIMAAGAESGIRSGKRGPGYNLPSPKTTRRLIRPTARKGAQQKLAFP